MFPLLMSVAFAERVTMSVALSTENSAEYRDSGVDHTGDRLGEVARGAELLAETHRDQSVDKPRPVHALHGRPRSSWAGKGAIAHADGGTIHS